MTRFPSSVLEGDSVLLTPVVAVVDDDLAVVRSLEFSLGVEGYVVQSFHTAWAFLDHSEKAAGHVKAGCLVVDYKLPGMSGIEMIDELISRGAIPPTVLITSNPDQRCRLWASQTGVPLVEKPLLDETLTDRIRAAFAA